MKRNLYYLPLILIAIILFSACNTTMMKRHYRKGFFVEHKHHPKTPVVKQNKPEEALAVNPPPTLVPEKNEFSKSEELNRETEPELIPQQKEKKSFFARRNEKTHAAIFPPLKMDKIKGMAEKVVGPEAGLVSATLSLFWIVLVVLLVIYLVGVVFEGFGLGGIYHLLALVILILLILWLLGVV